MLVGFRILSSDSTRRFSHGNLAHRFHVQVNGSIVSVVDEQDDTRAKSTHAHFLATNPFDDVAQRLLLGLVSRQYPQASIVIDGSYLGKFSVLHGESRQDLGLIGKTIEFFHRYESTSNEANVERILISVAEIDEEENFTDLLSSDRQRPRSAIRITEDFATQVTAVEGLTLIDSADGPAVDAIRGLFCSSRTQLITFHLQFASTITSHSRKRHAAPAKPSIARLTLLSLGRGGGAARAQKHNSNKRQQPQLPSSSVVPATFRHAVHAVVGSLRGPNRPAAVPFSRSKLTYLLKGALCQTQPSAWLVALCPVSPRHEELAEGYRDAASAMMLAAEIGEISKEPFPDFLHDVKLSPSSQLSGESPPAASHSSHNSSGSPFSNSGGGTRAALKAQQLLLAQHPLSFDDGGAESDNHQPHQQQRHHHHHQHQAIDDSENAIQQAILDYQMAIQSPTGDAVARTTRSPSPEEKADSPPQPTPPPASKNDDGPGKRKEEEVPQETRLQREVALLRSQAELREERIQHLEVTVQRGTEVSAAEMARANDTIALLQKTVDDLSRQVERPRSPPQNVKLHTSQESLKRQLEHEQHDYKLFRDATEHTLHRLRSELEERRARDDHYARELKRRDREISEHKADLVVLARELKGTEDRLSRQQHLVDDAHTKEVDTLTRSLAKVDEALVLRTEERDELQSLIETMQMSLSLKTQQQYARPLSSTCHTQTDLAAADMLEIVKEVRDRTAECAELRAAHQSVTSHRRQLEEQQAIHVGVIADLEESLRCARSASEAARSDCHTKTAAHSALEEENAQLRRQVAGLIRDLGQANAQIAELQDHPEMRAAAVQCVIASATANPPVPPHVSVREATPPPPPPQPVQASAHLIPQRPPPAAFEPQHRSGGGLDDIVEYDFSISDRERALLDNALQQYAGQ